jgi:hypothetical protein
MITVQIFYHLCTLQSISDQAANLTESKKALEDSKSLLWGHAAREHELSQSVADAMRVSVGRFDKYTSKISSPAAAAGGSGNGRQSRLRR